jgi:hypothetical protein
MRAYLGKQLQDATADVTPTHGIILYLVRRVDDVGYNRVITFHLLAF